VDPSDQRLPPDYCHPEDHGDPPVPVALDALLERIQRLPRQWRSNADAVMDDVNHGDAPRDDSDLARGWLQCADELEAALRAAGPQKTPAPSSVACRDLIDVNEAARISGLAKATFYKLVRRQRLRSFKVLAALRFDRRDVLALVNERPATDDARKG
jgi:predicted DNA-binding transcriptional regulator AlpA